MNDLTYVKGNVFDNVPDEFALSSFGYIKRDINDIKNEYIRLGFHLAECKRYRYYEQFGYDNFNEFVFSNFGLEKSSLSRCLSVYERFAMCEGPFSTPKMFIDKKYSDFSYSQLCEMVSMSDDMVKRVNPDMTISQIRALKKGISSFGCDVATVNEVTHTKDFDYDKYISLSGAALYSYVKSCHSSSRLFLSLMLLESQLIFSIIIGLMF